MRRKMRRWLSALLIASMTVTGMGLVVQADTDEDTGLCEHHTSHDALCGYQKAVEAHPCGHVHTEECYKATQPATPGSAEYPAATPGGAAPAGGRVLDCPHARGIHDEECGYAEAAEGRPCTFVCDVCGTLTYVDENGEARQEKLGTGGYKKVSEIGSRNTWGADGETTWYFVDKSCSFHERLTVKGNLNLVLGQGSTLTAQSGILVPGNASLTIYGQTMTGGTLKATGAGYGAGIGGDGRESAGCITIKSGHVIAYGPAQSGTDQARMAIPAAIGSGYGKGGMKVTIAGGLVEAYGTDGGAGIGGSWYNADGFVRITGGDVYAKGGSVNRSVTSGGAVGGAGIGSASGGTCGEITITGGRVEAAGGAGAAGIGRGSAGKWRNGSSQVTVEGPVRLTARGDLAAVDGGIDLSGYGGNYYVIGSSQNKESDMVTELSVNGEKRSLPSDDAPYRYLKAEPLSIAAAEAAGSVSDAHIGDTAAFEVRPAGGQPDVNLTKVLGTVWSVEGASSPNTSINDGGLLFIGGDESSSRLLVRASCGQLPGGLELEPDYAVVNVAQAAYQVFFDGNGGTASRDRMQTYQGRLSEALPTAVREGHTFGGWYTERNGGERIDEGYVFSQDTTVYALWTANRYTVTWHTMGGSPETFSRGVNYGGHVPAVAFTAKDLSVFEGWYTDLSYTRRWDLDRDVVKGDMHLYAKWSDAVLDAEVTALAVPSYGGTVSNTGRYRLGAQVTLKADASAGYRFECWMEDGRIVGTSPDYTVTVDSDRSLTAVFEQVKSHGSSGGGIGSSGGGIGSSGGGVGSSGGGGGGSRGGGGSGSGSSGGGASAPGAQVPDVSSATPLPAVPTAEIREALPDYVEVGSWNQAADGSWTFRDEEGQAYTNRWAAVYNPYAAADAANAFDWFRFDAAGRLITGWYTDPADGNTYYMNPNADGTQGRMMTGWVVIDGKEYYFNPNSDGTRGKLLTNCTTPDGHYVGPDGAKLR